MAISGSGAGTCTLKVLLAITVAPSMRAAVTVADPTAQP